MNEEFTLLALYKALKKIDSLQYVSSIKRVDDTIIVMNKDGSETNFNMIKGVTGARGLDYNIDVARDGMRSLVAEYKLEEVEEVKTILGLPDGN